MSKKEKLILFSAITVFLVSITFWAVNYYVSSTQAVADYGGEYTEGMVGEPSYLNPILAPQLSEVDASICQMVFSSLLKYDDKGNLVNDLAESYEKSDDGTLYTFKIKEGATWHDGQPLTARDIAFTIGLIQDPAYKANNLRGEWQKEEVQVNVDDDRTISFRLNKPYAPFLNRLTFGILPQHLFEEVGPENFLLDELNLKPIGSGPFVFSDFKKDSEGNVISYHLIANQQYFKGKPYLDKININFYPDENALKEAFSKKEINGFGAISYQDINSYAERKDTRVIDMRTPRYFAIFFNETKSKPLAEDDIRKALSYATNRKDISEQVFDGYAKPIYGPILPSLGEFESSNDTEKYEYNPEKAKEILENSGWKSEDGSPIRKKDDQQLSVSIITTQWPDLAKTAEIIKSQWAQVGVDVQVSNLTIKDIQQNFIKPREYQSILYGQEYYGSDPDPYFFWHSSGKKDPGRNIAVFEDEKVDELLQGARESQSLDERKEKYAEMEKIISQQAPAVFLYSPDYVYVMSNKIKGCDKDVLINPAYRFSNINEWYVKTKRVRKNS